jgi:hypothetical protein
MTASGWRRSVPLLAAAAMSALVPVTPGAAADPRPVGSSGYGVFVTIGHPCLDLRIEDPGNVTLTQRRNGKPITSATYDPEARDGPPCLKPLRPGDRLRIQQGSFSRVVTVPSIGLAVDPATDHVRIQLPTTGELGGSIAILDHIAGEFSGTGISEAFTAEPNGIEEGSIPGIDIGAGDGLRVTWYDGPDSWVKVWQNGSVAVRVGRSEITGTGTPGSTVAVTLHTARGTLRGTARATRVGFKADTAPGGFSAVFRRGRSPVKVRAGDVIRHSQIRGSFTVPAKNLVVDPLGAGSLTLSCPKHGAYVVLVDKGDVDAGPSGNGRIAVNDLGGPLAAGTVVEVACDTPKGYGVVQRVVVP